MSEIIDGGEVQISPHKSDHESGGGDAIKLDDLAAPDDNTDLDADESAHGLCPKLGMASVDTQYIPLVLFNTDVTPPVASGFPLGTIYIQYTP